VQLWNNEERKRFRAGLVADDPPDTCRQCVFYCREDLGVRLTMEHELRKVWADDAESATASSSALDAP